MRWPEGSESWPLTDHSRIVTRRPHRWHVQEMGTGPVLLLLHGAGGATHSFRDLMPGLAKRYRVVALDLPGHGYTTCGARTRCGLAPMAEDIAALITAEGWPVAAVIGHSAGAALALQLQRTAGGPRCPVVAINPALAPFQGIAAWLFPALARALSVLPFVTGAAAAAARAPGTAERLIDGTGSDIGAEGVALYARLLRDRDHVDGALSMMAAWRLDDLLSGLEAIESPVLLLLADNDRMVPPGPARRAAARLPHATLRDLPDGGHLLHEQCPELVRAEISAFLDRCLPGG